MIVPDDMHAGRCLRRKMPCVVVTSPPTSERDVDDIFQFAVRLRAVISSPVSANAEPDMLLLFATGDHELVRTTAAEPYPRSALTEAAMLRTEMARLQT